MKSPLLLALTLALAPLAGSLSARAETAVAVPPPAAEAPPQAGGLETAVLAGGCFWGIQAVYQHVKGVTNAVSGYAGGARADADYRKVSSGRTDHAETVSITFDPRQVSYGKILQIYFSVAHDPTQLDRQGPTASNIVRRFSRKPTRSARRRRPISRSSTRRRCSASRSSPRWGR